MVLGRDYRANREEEEEEEEEEEVEERERDMCTWSTLRCGP